MQSLKRQRQESTGREGYRASREVPNDHQDRGNEHGRHRHRTLAQTPNYGHNRLNPRIDVDQNPGANLGVDNDTYVQSWLLSTQKHRPGHPDTTVETQPRRGSSRDQAHGNTGTSRKRPRSPSHTRLPLTRETKDTREYRFEKRARHKTREDKYDHGRQKTNQSRQNNRDRPTDVRESDRQYNVEARGHREKHASARKPQRAAHTDSLAARALKSRNARLAQKEKEDDRELIELSAFFGRGDQDDHKSPVGRGLRLDNRWTQLEGEDEGLGDVDPRDYQHQISRTEHLELPKPSRGASQYFFDQQSEAISRDTGHSPGPLSEDEALQGSKHTTYFTWSTSHHSNVRDRQSKTPRYSALGATERLQRGTHLGPKPRSAPEEHRLRQPDVPRPRSFHGTREVLHYKDAGVQTDPEMCGTKDKTPPIPKPQYRNEAIMTRPEAEIGSHEGERYLSPVPGEVHITHGGKGSQPINNAIIRDRYLEFPVLQGAPAVQDLENSVRWSLSGDPEPLATSHSVVLARGYRPNIASQSHMSHTFSATEGNIRMNPVSERFPFTRVASRASLPQQKETVGYSPGLSGQQDFLSAITPTDQHSSREIPRYEPERVPAHASIEGRCVATEIEDYINKIESEALKTARRTETPRPLQDGGFGLVGFGDLGSTEIPDGLHEPNQDVESVLPGNDWLALQPQQQTFNSQHDFPNTLWLEYPDILKRNDKWR